MRQGSTGPAIAAYRELLARAPDLPESWFNLAYLQRQGRRYEEALESYGQALRRGVSGPEEAHLNRASILSAQLGRYEEARDELETALALAPGYLPALLNLGNLHEDLGEREAASTTYERALDLAPGHPLALARLGGLSRTRDRADPLLARIEAALRQPALPPLAQADLGFALGRLLDRCGAFDEAFAVCAEANRQASAAFGPAARYDAAAAERLIERITAAFPPPAATPCGNPAGAPVFICGMFRSGSTLVEQMLGRHSRVHPAGELDILPGIVARQMPNFPQEAEARDTAWFAGLREAYETELTALVPKGLIATDKRPDNFLFIGLIKRMFPEARIVMTRRNPCDNALSVFFQQLDPRFAYAARLEEIAHWMGLYDRLAAHWRTCFNDDIIEVDYDRLVASPEAEIGALLDFLGLEREQACLSPEGGDAPVRTASVWQVREPLYRQSSGRWRNYAAHLGPLLERFSCD